MEQENQSSGHTESIPHRRRESWDIGAISHALQHSPDSEPVRDPAHGSGVRYDLAGGALIVDLFPPNGERMNGIVRLATADSLQEFYRQPQPAIREEGLIFETGELLISLSPTGEVATYRRVHDEGTQGSINGAESEEEDSDAFDGDQGPDGHSAASRRPFQNVLPETEGQPRVSYSGRLGTNPRTKLTPKGAFVMQFPVAVPIEGRDKPEWRSTIVFDGRARKLDGVLAKGTTVDVVAYEHRKVSKDPRTGKSKERIEYYATAVTPKPRKHVGDAHAPGGASERQRP
jgi:hypothetical protein